MQLKDFVQIGDEKAVSEHLKATAAKYENEANRLWSKVELDSGARVWPGILRCLARQLTIIDAGQKLPIEVMAGACRTVFELSIRTRQMVSQPALVTEFLGERAFDEIGLIEGMKKLTKEPELLAPFDARLQQLRTAIRQLGAQQPVQQSMWHRAKAAKMAKEYNALYGFYSKYTHGTPWLSITRPEDRDGAEYRNVLLLQAQVYAEDAFVRIQKFVREYVGNRPPQS